MPMLDPGGEAHNYKLYVRNCGGVITCVYSTITGNGIVHPSLTYFKAVKQFQESSLYISHICLLLLLAHWDTTQYSSV